MGENKEIRGRTTDKYSYTSAIRVCFRTLYKHRYIHGGLDSLCDVLIHRTYIGDVIVDHKLENLENLTQFDTFYAIYVL